MAQEKEVRQAPGEYPANQPHILESDGRASDQEKANQQRGSGNDGGDSSGERQRDGDRGSGGNRSERK